MPHLETVYFVTSCDQCSQGFGRSMPTKHEQLLETNKRHWVTLESGLVFCEKCWRTFEGVREALGCSKLVPAPSDKIFGLQGPAPDPDLAF
jgi:hypothetical protein